MKTASRLLSGRDCATSSDVARRSKALEMSQTEMICQIDKFCMIFCMQHTETLPSWKGVVEAGGVMEGYFRIQL